jgi:hypothetical protein
VPMTGAIGRVEVIRRFSVGGAGRQLDLRDS